MQVVNAVLSDKIYYDDEIVLTYKINYPQFFSNKCQRNLSTLNAFYKENAEIFEQYCRDTLFTEAVDQYHELKKNDYPFHPYEAIVDYKTTYLSCQFISLYFDKYIYTGGAHGNTIRHSDTWNLSTGKTMHISEYFPMNENYKNDILTFIIDEITNQLKNPESKGKYFDTYQQDVHNTWNEDNFYLTPAGIVVYFQQYDIAPYSSGIIEFLIPFKS
ncbi:DUF3298 and DUF4163 domain-containing protein [Clostridium sp. Marseille-P299]|uniref:DUF3298 and DUF4163 domain-containing protein n=1 Tax=Clostridium sp. Marseille-P299 TaxID=1805477 RepID=UPI00082E8907|nr:DUF3298 and DUF4163 domain-containing protein [Clostridium sp. Marseille-P299]